MQRAQEGTNGKSSPSAIDGPSRRKTSLKWNGGSLPRCKSTPWTFALCLPACFVYYCVPKYVFVQHSAIPACCPPATMHMRAAKGLCRQRGRGLPGGCSVLILPLSNDPIQAQGFACAAAPSWSFEGVWRRMGLSSQHSILALAANRHLLPSHSTARVVHFQGVCGRWGSSPIASALDLPLLLS